jgi:hypothetical protein
MEEQAEEKLVRPANKATTNKYYLQKFDAAMSWSIQGKRLMESVWSLCCLLHIWIPVPVYVLLDIYAHLPLLVNISDPLTSSLYDFVLRSHISLSLSLH